MFNDYTRARYLFLIVCWRTNTTNRARQAPVHIDENPVLVLELYGNHWEDIAVCAGLVSTATVVLLVVFLPKVRPQIKEWDRGAGLVSTASVVLLVVFLPKVRPQIKEWDRSPGARLHGTCRPSCRLSTQGTPTDKGMG